MSIIRVVTILFVAPLLVGLQVYVSAQTPLPPGCQELVSNGGFEKEGGWLLRITQRPGLIVSDEAHSGSQALFLGLDETTPNEASHSIAQQSMTLPATAQQITLSLWSLVRSPGDANDRNYVLFLSPNGEIAAIPLYTPLSARGWQQFTFDVTDLAGQQLRLQIGVANDGTGSKAAWLVDDVSLLACLPPSVSTPTSTPVPPTATPSATPAGALAMPPTATPTTTPTATPSPEPTAAPTSTPTATPTTRSITTAATAPIPDRAVAAGQPTSTPTATRTPLDIQIPEPPSSLLNNEAAPVLLGTLLSSLLILVVMAISLRRGA